MAAQKRPGCAGLAIGHGSAGAQLHGQERRFGFEHSLAAGRVARAQVALLEEHHDVGVIQAGRGSDLVAKRGDHALLSRSENLDGHLDPLFSVPGTPDHPAATCTQAVARVYEHEGKVDELLDEVWMHDGFRDADQSAHWRARARGMVTRYAATLDPAALTASR